MHKNLISWLSWKCVAARTVFLSCRLLPLILMDMYVGVSCFDLQVLLNQMVAVVLCSLHIRFLNSRISFACLALASFMFVRPYTSWFYYLPTSYKFVITICMQYSDPLFCTFHNKFNSGTTTIT